MLYFLQIRCDVPQGSILGPLLFIIYINVIVKWSYLFQFIMFADDTNLFASHSNVDELLKIVNQEIAKISNWLKINKLSLNVEKTHCIIFHNRQKKIHLGSKIFINSVIIEQVSFTKFLGVRINENLNWSNQISAIIAKISKNLGIIWRVARVLPSEVLYSLYHTLISPYLDYCNIVCASYNSTFFHNLFRTQKKAIRLINNSPWNTHVSPLFYKSGILKLHDITTFQLLALCINPSLVYHPCLFSLSLF